jgi:hypothetical protein
VHLLFASEEVVWLSWRVDEDVEEVENLPHTSDVVGSFVTAGGRIRLYGFLDKLGDKALYCDTDSVIYVQGRGESALVETGDNLGDMASELKPNESITEYVGAGPKNYAYRTVNIVTGESKTTCKVRGVHPNYSASQVVNFEAMKNLILNRAEAATVNVHTSKEIKRRRGKGGEGTINIISEPEDKLHRVSFLKRRRLADHNSVPFGYIDDD